MIFTVKTRILASATLLVAIATAQAQQGPDWASIEFSHTDLGNGIYMLQGRGGNLGLSVGDDGAFLIDDEFPQMASKAVETIAEITDAPVEYLVNTHWHGDHTGGNAVFHSHGSRILAHDNVRVRMAAPGPQQSAPQALPELTYSEHATLHFNGHDIHLMHVSDAHTDGDTVVHFRNLNVIHTGDVMFNGMYPFIDLDSGGTVSGYIDALKLIANLADEQTQIIPGHGPLAGKEDVQTTIKMLQDTRAAVAPHVAAGKTLEEVLEAQPLAAFDEAYSWAFINGPRFTATLYNDLKAQ